MKKISLFLLGVFIGAFVTYYFFTNSSVADTPITDVVPPKGLITPQKAKMLDEAFDSRHALISKSIVMRPDNRSTWWSLEDMQKYLAYAEKESADLGYTMTGVRVYLGTYPTVEEVGYTTMFLVPTGAKDLSKAGSTFFSMTQDGKGDIPGGSGLNDGGMGNPPSVSYPQ